MDSALIVSTSTKGNAFFQEVLKAVGVAQAKVVGSCGEARRQLLERAFDLVLVNAPLGDEPGEQLAREVAAAGDAMAILVVRYESFAAVTSVVAPEGVLTVAKPLDSTAFWSVLKLAESTLARLRKVQDENRALLTRIEDIRIVDRAKCLLIAKLRLSEEDAHRAIEKQAMDRRLTRREVAEEILRAYGD